VASLSQGRTAAAQCGLFTHKSVPVIFEPPCIFIFFGTIYSDNWTHSSHSVCSGVISGRVRRPRRELYALPSSAEVKKEWIYTSTLHICLIPWTETLTLQTKTLCPGGKKITVRWCVAGHRLKTTVSGYC